MRLTTVLSLLSCLVASVAVAADATLVPRAPLPAEPVVVFAEHEALVVKWADAVRARTDDAGRVRFVGGAPPGWEDLRLTWQIEASPWLATPERTLRDLQARAAERSGRAQPDLAGLHRLRIPDPSPDRLRDLALQLLSLDAVEFVTVDPVPVEPPADIPPETPVLSDRQGYLGPDPGIDATHAWEVWGLTGAGVRVSDCEYGWDVEHEDLVAGGFTLEPGQTWPADVVSRGWHHHGTAVAGELVGLDNGYGVTGIVPAADFAMYPEWTIEEGYRRGTAITNAIADSAPGDVVLLEMQTRGPDGRLAPAEVNPAVWLIVRTGVDAGVHVVGAAGNGAADLDGSAYAEYRERGDSGAILVGAGSSNTNHSRLGFSTYGERVDLQGWGQNVFTTGYGAFARYGGDEHQAYTHRFSGTSSASPIVTGALALLIEAHGRYRTTAADPGTMRDLLIETGIPAGSGRIGPFPDLAAALDALDADLDIPPRIVSTTVPDGALEGQTATLSVEVEHLPTHAPSVVWTAGSDVLGEGTTLELPLPDDGAFPVQVTLTDAWDRSVSESLTVTAANVAPTLAPLGIEGEAVEGGELVVRASASDPGEDTITIAWTVDGEDAGTGDALTWTFADDGTYTVTATASDEDGGVSEPVTVEVTVEDVPPVVTLEVPATAPRKTPVSLSVSIEDPGEDTHSVVWDVGDPDLEGALLEGAVVEHAWRKREVYTVRVTVTDEDGVQVEQSATLEVVPRQACGCASGGSGGGLAGLLVALGLIGRRRRASSTTPGTPATASSRSARYRCRTG